MTIDRLDAMRTFVAIADAGSFSLAAKRLNLSVPAMSRRLSGFEARIGADLMRRTTRSVELTAFGRRYYERAKTILADIEAAELELTALQGTPAGLLKVAAPGLFGRTFVAPLIPDFLDCFPRVQVDFSLAPPPETEGGNLDAIVEVGDQASQNASVSTLSLGSFRQVLCASPAYLERTGHPLKPDDLRHHACILEHGAEGSHTWTFHANGRPAGQPVHGRLICDDTDAALSAAVAGAGIARAPSFQVREHVRNRRLAVLLEDFEPPPTQSWVAYAKHRAVEAKVGAFVRFMSERIPQERLGL